MGWWVGGLVSGWVGGLVSRWVGEWVGGCVGRWVRWPGWVSWLVHRVRQWFMWLRGVFACCAAVGCVVLFLGWLPAWLLAALLSASGLIRTCCSVTAWADTLFAFVCFVKCIAQARTIPMEILNPGRFHSRGKPNATESCQQA